MKIKLLMAHTIDGKVARSNNEFTDWTGSEDKKYFVEQTMACGVVIMGSKTYDTFSKPLPGRFNVIMTRNPNKYKNKQHANVFFTNQKYTRIIKGLDIAGYKTACLIGGSTINTLFAKAGLIDEIHITTVPRIFGSGLSMFTEPLDIPLRLKTFTQLGDGVMVHIYDVIKDQHKKKKPYGIFRINA